MKNCKNIILGIILIVVGVWFGLYATGVVKINLLFDGWWTLFIIVPSFLGLFDEDGLQKDFMKEVADLTKSENINTAESPLL